jgi:macrodomain Ter protein organizer (MatP/YcbG family)
MRTIIGTLILLLFVSNAFSQQKAETVNEIDWLCRQFKDGESIKITNEQGTVNATINVMYNTDGKPYKITMSGSYDEWKFRMNPAVEMLLDQVMAEKLSKGYKTSDYQLFTKAQYLCRITTGNYKKSDLVYTFWFEIENVDTKRILGSKTPRIGF